MLPLPTLPLLALVTALSSVLPALPEPTGLAEVVVRGNGPVPVLLIGCMSCRWNAWEDFMALQPDRYRMIAVTIPGFGGTPAPALPENTGATPYRDNALASLGRLIDSMQLKRVVVVGHSWGAMLAIQLAARRPDAVARVVNVDGFVESDSWTPRDSSARRIAADGVMQTYGASLDSADAWARFNWPGLPRDSLIERARAVNAMKLYGSFMATSRRVLLQYWRENLLIDLTAVTRSLRVPVLTVKALQGADQDKQRAAHDSVQRAVGVSGRVRTTYLLDTGHYVMHERPRELLAIIQEFVGQ